MMQKIIVGKYYKPLQYFLLVSLLSSVIISQNGGLFLSRTAFAEGLVPMDTVMAISDIAPTHRTAGASSEWSRALGYTNDAEALRELIVREGFKGHLDVVEVDGVTRSLNNTRYEVLRELERARNVAEPVPVRIHPYNEPLPTATKEDLDLINDLKRQAKKYNVPISERPTWGEHVRIILKKQRAWWRDLGTKADVKLPGKPLTLETIETLKKRPPIIAGSGAKTLPVEPIKTGTGRESRVLSKTPGVCLGGRFIAALEILGWLQALQIYHDFIEEKYDTGRLRSEIEEEAEELEAAQDYIHQKQTIMKQMLTTAQRLAGELEQRINDYNREPSEKNEKAVKSAQEALDPVVNQLKGVQKDLENKLKKYGIEPETGHPLSYESKKCNPEYSKIINEITNKTGLTSQMTGPNEFKVIGVSQSKLPELKDALQTAANNKRVKFILPGEEVIKSTSRKTSIKQSRPAATEKPAPSSRPSVFGERPPTYPSIFEGYQPPPRHPSIYY